jgi:valyl-tRNA synthetase
MSKSLGNGIDPIEVVNRFGADAMKFTLAYMATQGQDIKIDMESFNLGSRFANKIWNASRFLLMNLEGTKMLDVKEIKLRTMDKWIYHKFNQAVKNVTDAIDAYRFNDAAQACYDFFWNDFCDWYIEYSKQGLYSNDPDEKNRTVTLLLDLLSESLKLMHPFVSFVTEEIYDKLPGSEGHLITQRYPVYQEERNHPDEALLVSRGQEAVAAIRAARNELSIPVDKKVRIVIKPDSGFVATDFFLEEKSLIAAFVNASDLVVDAERKTDVKGTFPVAGTGYASYLFVREAVDVAKEIDKLSSELSKNQQFLEQTMKKLGNPQFMEHAKSEAIEKEQGKKVEFEEKISKANAHLKLLKSLE